MARIIVVGATGRTGKLLVEQLSAQGEEVVAIFRDAAKRQVFEDLGAETVITDLAGAEISELAAAMAGGDAVIFAAGTRENEDNVEEIDRDGAIKTAEAAREAGVSRFVQISAMGVRTGMPEGLDDKMQAYYRAKQQGDEHLRASDLDWTIIEPGELTEGAGTGRIKAAADLKGFGSIPRADVAATVIAALSVPSTIGKALEVLSGEFSVTEALEQAAL